MKRRVQHFFKKSTNSPIGLYWTGLNQRRGNVDMYM